MYVMFLLKKEDGQLFLFDVTASVATRGEILVKETRLL